MNAPLTGVSKWLRAPVVSASEPVAEVLRWEQLYVHALVFARFAVLLWSSVHLVCGGSMSW